MSSDNSGRDQYERRWVLRTLGVAGVTAVGAGTATQPAAGGDTTIEKSEDCSPEETPPAIYTADHVDTDFWGSVHITDGNTSDNYETIGDEFPEAPDELLVHCHGWQNDADCGKQRLNETRAAYDEQEYDGFVTGLVWDSSYAWWNAKEIADKNAVKLANFLTDFKDENPETTIRLQGHSLGARVVAETMFQLDEELAHDVVTSVIFMAGAIENHSVSMDGRYGSAIENAAQHAENFWMEDDTILDWAFTTYEASKAIGNDGCDGPKPDNYTDHHIQLADHSDHYKPDDGIIEEVIDTFEEEQEGSNLSDDPRKQTNAIGNAVEEDDEDWNVPGMSLPAIGAGIGGVALLSRLTGDDE